MATYEHSSTFPDITPEELFAWHEREGAIQRMIPPFEDVRVVERTGGIDDGTLVLEMHPLPLYRPRWVAEHVDFERGRQFRDVMAKGPFRSWVHTHRFEATTLTDHIEYELGFPMSLGGFMVRNMLETSFPWRHQRLGRDLARHAAFADRPRKVVAITGATGGVGTQLGAFLTTGGHEVRRITRRPKRDTDIGWDLKTGELDAAKLEGVDAVIHLAGASVSKRWTPLQKEAILQSRIQGTRLLTDTLLSLDSPPEVLISSSAVGGYGDRGDEVLTEESPLGESGFLEEVCRAWEAESEPVIEAGIRRCVVRTGVVMDASSGALAELLPIFKLCGGGPVGSGTQWVPWIDLDDLLAIYHHLLMTDLEGVFNGTAPNPVTNREQAKTLGRVLRRPAIVPAPAFAVRLVLGEMSRLVTDSARVIPKRLLDEGFRFDHSTLESSLRWQLGR